MLRGTIRIPGDKSMSHRAALFAALRDGKSVFKNFNLNNDCAATLSCLSKMGVKHNLVKDTLTIWGKHPESWIKPAQNLNAQNSGTTARLISGILSSLKFKTTLTGDESLSKRPMKRIINPLEKMGAKIDSNNMFLPLDFHPVQKLKGINYELPVASAQVKSAVLLAGLFAEGDTCVIENIQTRDHTERLLQLKCEYEDSKKRIYVSNKAEVPDISMRIPGDFSSAAFFISAALIVPDSSITIEGVSLNPTRTGYLNVLQEMGADIEFKIEKAQPEPIGSIKVGSSTLRNITVPKELVPNIIDEIPVLAIVASQCDGELVLHHAEELRFKESDRISTIVSNLRNLGIVIDEFDDGFSICGLQKIKEGKVITHGDHRIAMAFTIAQLVAEGTLNIDDPGCASVSFPEFYDILKRINA